MSNKNVVTKRNTGDALTIEKNSSQIIGDILEKHTSEFVVPLKDSFAQKRKLIDDAKDMSTEEKIVAYERAENKYLNDIGKYLMIVAVAVGVPFLLKNTDIIKKTSKYLSRVA